ncbi:hypothetical protein SAY87_019989 [Trapa incisa]|uniref:Bifunctional inhibitor/plant lipid transfer protein/seed storage helical domain-containing protein n=1 Tax=Trapa incisa TaxID=236973 RepID=A0AAN7Q3J5_9MYRT|nr:hypothetical protein SAY87_019989 [Trapa incisa]
MELQGLEAELSRPIFLAMIVLAGAYSTAQAQISTPCTASMITSFTPCFNFITGSSANGGSPIHDCCESFRSMIRTSIECTCLIITANVPIPLINRNLSISLPRACNTGGIPIQCKASGTQLPPPGPILFAPPPPPPPAVIALPPSTAADSPSLAPSPFSSQASKAEKTSTPHPTSPSSAPAAPLPPASAPELAFSPGFVVPTDMAPADAPDTGTMPRTSGIRPVLNPFNSNSSPCFTYPPLSFLMILIGMIIISL